MEKMDNGCDLEKPQNLRERRSFYRFFYHTVPEVGTAIDETSFKNFRLGDIDDTWGNPGLRLYAYKFFNKMSERLNIAELINQICLEYFLIKVSIK